MDIKVIPLPPAPAALIPAIPALPPAPFDPAQAMVDLNNLQGEIAAADGRKRVKSEEAAGGKKRVKVEIEHSE